MKEDVNKDEILKRIKRQMIAFLILFIATGGAFIYLSNQIFELESRVRKMEHELDYTKYRIEELEKTNK